MSQERVTQSETNLVRKIILNASAIGNKLWRQNSGQGWVGKSTVIKRRETVFLNPGDVVIENARPFHSGFVGQPDAGGWVSVVITPDMVGKTVAIACQVEVKKLDGVEAVAQQKFGEMALEMGVRWGFARSIEDSVRIMNGE